MSFPFLVRPPFITENTGITWNSSDKDAAISLSNGNLDATGSGGAFKSVRATISRSSGKRYFEMLIVGTNGSAANVNGIGDAAMLLSTYPGNSSKSSGTQWSNGASMPRQNGFTLASGFTVSGTTVANDVHQIAVDLDAGNLWYGRNGTYTSGNPALGTTPTLTGVTGTLFPAAGLFDNTTITRLRTKMASFTYAMPTGFRSWAKN